MWWAKRALNVVSVEHDPEWFAKIISKLQGNYRNVYLMLEQDKECYINSILKQDLRFDVVVIDGRWRGVCANVIGKKLNFEDGFIIILDNSDWYPETTEYIRKKYDTIQVNFHGFGAINPYTWTTSIFYPRNISFDFKEKACLSVSPLKQIAEDDKTCA